MWKTSHTSVAPSAHNPANTNPTQTNERLWEGVDLVMLAWTSHDGPVNFEGRFFHRRAVNIWPRPYQQPHPPIWITGSNDKENIKKVAGRGYTFAMFLQPHDKVRDMFDAYRASYRDNGVPGCGRVEPSGIWPALGLQVAHQIRHRSLHSETPAAPTPREVVMPHSP